MTICDRCKSQNSEDREIRLTRITVARHFETTVISSVEAAAPELCIQCVGQLQSGLNRYMRDFINPAQPAK